MVLKSFVLEGEGKTNTSEEEYDTKVVPSGKKWKVLEVRPYFSRQDNDVEAYIYMGTERILEMNSQPANVYKRPYPCDVEIPASTELRLTGRTDGTSTDFIVEVIVSEE